MDWLREIYLYRELQKKRQYSGEIYVRVETSTEFTTRVPDTHYSFTM